NGPNEDERKREFFLAAATWPDVVRPKDRNDPRPCTSYHRRDWHFVDHYWKGVSGDPTNPPTDLSTPPMAEINAVGQLVIFRPFVVSNNAASDRAIDLAWILHLVGDIHQPLHTSGRVTATETGGDAGGNFFTLGPKLSLHSYWDGIVDRAQPRHAPNETFPNYIKRLTQTFESAFPKSHFTNLEPGQFEEWAKESLEKAKNNAYPKSLKRGQMPAPTYQAKTFGIAEESIAEGGYRLAALLDELFGGN
ncbi:MAG TPA: S1/P1 nuclease, partial [Pyrinomonadaceae bacterium]|nr:S1/P1 nuclease [Pyrinomonadaceae bacterium]